jgi:glutaredoxin
MKYNELVERIKEQGIPGGNKVCVGVRTSMFGEMQFFPVYLTTIPERGHSNPVLLFGSQNLIDRVTLQKTAINSVSDFKNTLESFNSKNDTVFAYYVYTNNEFYGNYTQLPVTELQLEDIVYMNYKLILDLKTSGSLMVFTQEIIEDEEEEIMYNPEAINDLDSAIECKKRLKGSNNMNAVKVYTSEFCNNCNIVKTYLKNNNIPYEEVDASTPENSKLLQEKGFSHLPIIEYNGEFTGNITVDKLKEIEKSVKNG